MHFKQISGIKFRPCHWILIGNMLSFIIFIWFEIMSSKKRSAKGTSEYLLFTVTAIWICSVLLALLSYIFHIFLLKCLEYVCICSFHSLDLFVLQLWVFINIAIPFIKIQLFTLDTMYFPNRFTNTTYWCSDIPILQIQI